MAAPPVCSFTVHRADGCVEDVYSAFRLVARQVGARAGVEQNGILLDDPSLEKMSVEKGKLVGQPR